MTKSNLLLSDFKPKSLLKRPDNTPEKAKFPAIDVHNHLFGMETAEERVKIMDEIGLRTFMNLSGNVTVPFDEKGYTLKRVEFKWFADNYIKRCPGRFAAFTMTDFAQWDDFTLIKDDKFADLAIQHMEEDMALGALGLKVTKELGLQFTDSTGKMIAVDDGRLLPIWRRAGELGKPILMHVSDPVGFFLPVDATNEHYTSLQEFPGWSFANSFYSKWELLEQRNRIIAANPKTTWILPHVANNPEDLDWVSALLDRFPNVYIDFSARIDELGRQPYSARDFFIKYQDRILFGVDMPVSAEVYRAYYRFLETRDEYFEYPDYIGRWGYCRWRIYGLHLPDEVLRKVYYENAVRLIPGLE